MIIVQTLRAYTNLTIIVQYNPTDRGCVNHLSFNSDGTLLVSGSDDRKLIVWDVRRLQLLHCVSTGHRSNIFGAGFLSNDKWLVGSASALVTFMCVLSCIAP
jgi:WD40 repeat protein